MEPRVTMSRRKRSNGKSHARELKGIRSMIVSATNKDSLIEAFRIEKKKWDREIQFILSISVLKVIEIFSH